MFSSGRTVFLLGAGFNLDASGEVGPTVPIATGAMPTPRYPIVGDLLQECFGVSTLPPGTSIENLFEEALEKKLREPFERLYDRLMEADYYVAGTLADAALSRGSIYRKFLTDFCDSSILTFNYDSFVEILLMAIEEWSPRDGYGVPVIVRSQSGFDEIDIRSRRPVLHLHGTLCVYARTFVENPKPGQGVNREIRMMDAEYVFDPDTIAHCFTPFGAGRDRGVGFRYLDERVIAPVPDKTRGLSGEFIRAVYEQAVSLVRDADRIVAVGYSFNPHDSASYEPILSDAGHAGVVVVAPDAENTVERLESTYAGLNLVAVPSDFRNWVLGGYAGLI